MTSKSILWGMLHLPALPGSPFNSLSLDEITDFILRDTEALIDGGINHLVIENIGDTPYYKTSNPPSVIAFMTRITTKIIQEFPDISLGVNVLRNDGMGALSIAEALKPNAEWIRVNVLSGAQVTDQGLIEGEAAKLLRYRTSLKSDIEIWADIDVKHAVPLVNRDPILSGKDTLGRGGASKLIISGQATGDEVSLELLSKMSAEFGREKLVIGSGTTKKNLLTLTNHCSNIIVGSYLKKEGKLNNKIDKKRVKELVELL